MEGGQLGGDEWTRHGSFVNKPSRGWLHSDGVVSTSGVSYTVRVSDGDGVPALAHQQSSQKCFRHIMTHIGLSIDIYLRSLHDCLLL